MSSSTGVFINPPPFGTVGDYSNLPTYDIGDRVHVNWTSSPSDSVLWLIQDGEGLLCEELNLGKTSCEVLLSGNRGTSWDWNILTPNNYSTSRTVYWLKMTTSGNSALFGSHYLNILPQNSAASSTSSASSITSTSSSTTSTGPSSTSSSSTSTSSASSPTATSSPDAGLSSGTKVGIGVALGIGIPLIILLSLIVFFMARKKKRNASTSASHDVPPMQTQYGHSHNGVPHQDYKDNAYANTQQWSGPQEMAANDYVRPPAEMPSSPRGYR